MKGIFPEQSHSAEDKKNVSVLSAREAGAEILT